MESFGSSRSGFYLRYLVLSVLCSLSYTQAYHEVYMNRRIPHSEVNLEPFKLGNPDVQVLIPSLEKQDARGLVASASDSHPIPAASQSTKDGPVVVKHLSSQGKIAHQNVQAAAPQKVDTPTSTSKPVTEASSTTSSNSEVTEITKRSSEKEEVTIKPNDKPSTTGSPDSSVTPVTSAEAVTIIPTTLKPPVEKERNPEELYCLCDIHVSVQPQFYLCG